MIKYIIVFSVDFTFFPVIRLHFMIKIRMFLVVFSSSISVKISLYSEDCTTIAVLVDIKAMTE